VYPTPHAFDAFVGSFIAHVALLWWWLRRGR
jgi:hypothetical protein